MKSFVGHRVEDGAVFAVAVRDIDIPIGKDLCVVPESDGDDGRLFEVRECGKGRRVAMLGGQERRHRIAGHGKDDVIGFVRDASGRRDARGTSGGGRDALDGRRHMDVSTVARDEIHEGIDERITERSAEERRIEKSHTAIHRAEELDERGRAGFFGAQALDGHGFERELMPDARAELLLEEKLRDREVIEGFRRAIIHAHDAENKTRELEAFAGRETGESRETTQGF